MLDFYRIDNIKLYEFLCKLDDDIICQAYLNYTKEGNQSLCDDTTYLQVDSPVFNNCCTLIEFVIRCNGLRKFKKPIAYDCMVGMIYHLIKDVREELV